MRPAGQRFDDFWKLVDGRKGWRFLEVRGRLCGTRTLEYPCGRSAAIWIESDERMRSRIEGHISIPFSAGPEESTCGSPKEIREWMDRKERTLLLPLTIGAAKTYQAAIEMASKIARRELYTLSYVFDLDDSGDVPEQRLRQKLVEACAPKLAKMNKAGL